MGAVSVEPQDDSMWTRSPRASIDSSSSGAQRLGGRAAPAYMMKSRSRKNMSRSRLSERRYGISTS